jgi:hypothetical protein
MGPIDYDPKIAEDGRVNPTHLFLLFVVQSKN